MVNRINSQVFNEIESFSTDTLTHVVPNVKTVLPTNEGNYYHYYNYYYYYY